jgi:hypothetical protein
MSNNSTPKQFIDEYNKLLDTLSASNSSRLFWATDFASKNRFSCPLPDILEGGKIDIPHVGLKRFFGVFFHAASLTIRMFKSKHLLTKLDGKKLYTVVKTFIYDHSFSKDGVYKDVFLGSLPDQLTENENVLILGYVLGNYDQCLAKMGQSKDLIIPIEACLRLRDIWQAVLDMLFIPIYVPAKLDFQGRDIASIVHSYFTHSFKGVQMRQFIQYWSTRNLSRRIKILKFYMTYENYPWERMSIWALREESPHTKVIGIQHTVVPQSFLNYFLSASELKKDLVPDAAFTTGEATADIIKRFSSVSLSNVYPGCALRFGHLHQIKEQPFNKPVKNILIALEASLKTESMVRYVLENLEDHNHYQIRIRTHPLLPWTTFEQTLGIKLPVNASISNTSLKEDLEWSDAVIYWSTTVSMEALMMGKPVIHYNMNGPLSFDPLFECSHFKWKAQKDVSLERILNEINELNEAEKTKMQADARQYLSYYFSPVTPQSLDRLCSFDN